VFAKLLVSILYAYPENRETLLEFYVSQKLFHADYMQTLYNTTKNIAEYSDIIHCWQLINYATGMCHGEHASRQRTESRNDHQSAAVSLLGRGVL